MRWVTLNMMVAVMLLHAMLGCCVHHSHAWQDAHATTQTHAAVALASGCHDHVGKCGPAGSHPQQDKPCQEEDCTFVRVAQDPVDAKAGVLCLDSVDSMTLVTAVSNWACEYRCGAGTIVSSLPVRSHLAKQVLLI